MSAGDDGEPVPRILVVLLLTAALLWILFGVFVISLPR